MVEFPAPSVAATVQVCAPSVEVSSRPPIVPVVVHASRLLPAQSVQSALAGTTESWTTVTPSAGPFGAGVGRSAVISSAR